METKTLLSFQGSETVIFPCECWLAKSEDDKETVRELVPSNIITEKLSRDGNLKVTDVDVEDALESKSASQEDNFLSSIFFSSTVLRSTCKNQRLMSFCWALSDLLQLTPTKCL